jgi:hypothetical protein
VGIAALAVAAQASPGWAKPSTAVLPFTGAKTKKHPDVERQLAASLCEAVTCVSASQVTTRGQVDWAKVSDAELTGVVIGKLTKDPKTKRNVADIQVMANARVILVRRKVTLQGTALSPAALVTLRNDLLGVLQRAHGPEKPPPAAAAPAPPAPGAPAAAAAASAAGVAAGTTGAAGAVAAPPTVAAPRVSAPEPAPSEAAAPAEAESPAREEEIWPPLLEVQATLGILHREYSVTGQASALILRNSIVSLLAEPGLFVAFNPLRSPEGFFASLGIEAGVATSVGVNIQRQNDTTGLAFPAVLFMANVDLRLKLRLGSAVLLEPVVGWQMMNFDVHPALDGTALTGQPGVHWRAISTGLGVRVAFASWCSLFAEFDYLFVLSLGPLTSAAYFPDASASPSFSGTLGLSFRVAPRLELRVGFAFQSYSADLNDATSPPRARSVSDQVAGGTLGARYSF